MLRNQLGSTAVGAVQVEADQYFTLLGDPPLRRLVESRPEVIFVDFENPLAGVHTLQLLHEALPECWLFVTAAVNDPTIIIEAMRAGAREFLVKPILPRHLSQALGRYITEKERGQKKATHGTIHCVTGAKGGAGATTVAINLASSLVRTPKTRVALVDLNIPMGDAAAYLNLRPQYTISDALAAASRLDKVLLQSYMSNAHGLAVLPGPRELSPEPPPGVRPVAVSGEGLTRMLDLLAQMYNHIFIDVTSTLDQAPFKTAVDMGSNVVVVLTPELPALWRARRLLGFLESYGAGQKLRFVLNRCRKTDALSEAEIEKALGRQVFWKLPNDYKVAIEAVNSGNPLVSNDHSPLTVSYRELADRLAGIAKPRKPSLLSRLFPFGSRS